AEFVQPFLESGHEMNPFGGRPAIEKPDHRQRLLRARRERPCRRAAEQRDELAPSPAPSPSRRVRRSGYGTLSLSQRDREVLGADLKCSKSRRRFWRSRL